ncbi:hypothetical protein E1B28_012637 [Marasmius oreades]|uniref:HPt domain-containing protein n=1 Tax=Marasmius oreades TaxID=181124 RepID=A0A9P7RS28_9AGAR|nr:uncharacterized protein E1B28_012637 [Marasmius oreades]KAG7088665.1 hypothetical protein E1B28_012637 [Marasmius oreades]
MSVTGAVKANHATNDRTPITPRTEPPPPTVSPKGDRSDIGRRSPEPKRPSNDIDETHKSPSSRPEPSSAASTKEVVPGAEDSEDSAQVIIDMEAFGQILDLDEDDTHDFSKEMVQEYFTQAKQTFTDLEQALEVKDLEKLSSLGHFLKGSSATLGVSAVQGSCEKIQNYGHLTDGTGGVLTSKDALEMITDLMGHVKRDYEEAEKWLRQWYKDNGMTEIS